MNIFLLEISPFALNVAQVISVAIVTFICSQTPVFPGLRVDSFAKSLLLAGLLSVLYSVLIFFFAPLNWLTLGIFGIVISALAIELADFLIEGVEIKGWGWALLLAVLVALTNAGVSNLLEDF